MTLDKFLNELKHRKLHIWLEDCNKKKIFSGLLGELLRMSYYKQTNSQFYDPVYNREIKRVEFTLTMIVIILKDKYEDLESSGEIK